MVSYGFEGFLSFALKTSGELVFFGFTIFFRPFFLEVNQRLTFFLRNKFNFV